MWLFLNGLPLGMVFGLVPGFLEGRRRTEAFVAGLCASFIRADGVTKSVGSGPFAFMVLLGLYIPCGAMHTTVFERLIARTRDRGNIGYLVYLDGCPGGADCRGDSRMGGGPDAGDPAPSPRRWTLRPARPQPDESGFHPDVTVPTSERHTGPLLPGCEHVPPPDPWHCSWDCRGECRLKCADYIEYVLEKEGDVAAVVSETVRSAPFIPPPDYSRRVRAACDKHGALLILEQAIGAVTA